MPEPAIVFASDGRIALQRGFDALAHLLALTLGPHQRGILNARDSHSAPEVLTDAATIARRFLALPDRVENVGAMLLRHLVWRVHQNSGDGCATAAVLARALLAESLRYVAAGVDPAQLRQGIETATDTTLQTLYTMARPVSDEHDLECVAHTAIHEPKLSLLLAELFDLLGPDAFITIEEHIAPYFEREYIEGGRWKGRLASPYFINDTVEQRAVLRDGTVVLFAGEVQEASAVQPLLELLVKHERRRLLFVAHAIQGTALATLVANHQREHMQIVAVELRRAGQQRLNDFTDLGALTGAHVLTTAAGDRLERITTNAFGRMRRAYASAEDLVVSGQRDRLRHNAQVAQLRQYLAASSCEQAAERDELHMRIGRLSGGVATLKIGALHKTERADLRRRTERGMRTLASALRGGMVPGGGVAYLNCIPGVEALSIAGDAAYGAKAVAAALEAPLRQLVMNARRHDPAMVLADIRCSGVDYGYDVHRGLVCDISQASMYDSTEIICESLRAAASGVTMALTTEAVVLKRRPKTSLEP
ncbi:MAG: TCP-1/cpn60 chaperonin family protein [Chloroflexota bacterium]